MQTGQDFFGNTIEKDVLLRDKFIEPPFTVLDARGGAWQRRKALWKQKGIKSEVGRSNDEIGMHRSPTETKQEWEQRYGRTAQDYTSIFDPSLCELMYRWFCPEGGWVLDPFAGGSVRGIVASYLGYQYAGIDIRAEQTKSNIEQAFEILAGKDVVLPIWYTGDSNLLLPKLAETSNLRFDFILSCPPYADLEVYSDLPGDISNMQYEDFLIAYNSIINKACRLLRRGAYAAWVVSDIRDKDGYYRDFISHTKRAFIDAGCAIYNDAVLIQPLGTAMLRADRQFSANQKLVKTHENVLVFKKL